MAEYEYVRRFVVQTHTRKTSRGNNHWDLRIENLKRRSSWSWALPKQKMPDFGKPIAAYRVEDHSVKYMDFEGTLDNGDKVRIYDKGNVALKLVRDDKLYLHFDGKKIKGKYIMIKMQPRPGIKEENETWLIIKGKDVESD